VSCAEEFEKASTYFGMIPVHQHPLSGTHTPPDREQIRTPKSGGSGQRKTREMRRKRNESITSPPVS